MASNNDAINESLSALIDNEHSDLDLRRILKAAPSDSSVEAKWSSYNTTRAIIQKEPCMTVSADFLSGIQDAIADDAELSNSSFPSWQRYTSKFAIAACVTFAFLIGVNQWQADNTAVIEGDNLADATLRNQPNAVVPSGFELPELSARTVSSYPGTESRSSRVVRPVAGRSEVILSPELQEQLNRMILKHAENASANGGLSVTPLTRVGTVPKDQE